MSAGGELNFVYDTIPDGVMYWAKTNEHAENTELHEKWRWDWPTSEVGTIPFAGKLADMLI